MPVRTTSTGAGSESTGAPKRETGWAAVAKRAAENAAKKKAKEEADGAIRDFWLKGGETAVIQFLNPEPFTVDGHSIKDGSGNWRFEPCQLDRQKYCLMCRDKIRTGFKAGFKILDYRGMWDKEAKEFKWDEPVEKMWLVNMTILGQLQAQKSKRGKPLDQLVLEVTRTGAGKDDTSYNFEQAFDDKDNKMLPVEWKSEFPPISELMKSRSDEALIEMGFEAPPSK